jgi:hypothetical protein
MPVDEGYRKQVTLLIKTVPLVAPETAFALKGGTAINLFLRDMPRLSVDIDLTYLPVADRESSLREIGAALQRIAKRRDASALAFPPFQRSALRNRRARDKCNGADGRRAGR